MTPLNLPQRQEQMETDVKQAGGQEILAQPLPPSDFGSDSSMSEQSRQLAQEQARKREQDLQQAIEDAMIDQVAETGGFPSQGHPGLEESEEEEEEFVPNLSTPAAADLAAPETKNVSEVLASFRALLGAEEEEEQEEAPLEQMEAEPAFGAPATSHPGTNSIAEPSAQAVLSEEVRRQQRT